MKQSTQDETHSEQWRRMRTLVRKAVEKFPKTARYRAINACEGIQKAEALFDTDKEIASFRALTAQEEAAAALFAALKYMKYPGADRLNSYTHPHKAALWFLVDATHRTLGKSFQAMQINVAVNASKPELIVSIPAKQLGIELPGKPNLAIQPVAPFHVLQSQDGRPYLFDAELAEIAGSAGTRSADRYIKRLANDRNKLLYASDTGLPKSHTTLEAIHSRRDRIYTLPIVCIGILQTPTIQHFVEQCLQALLGLVGKADGLIPLARPDSPVDVTIQRASIENA